MKWKEKRDLTLDICILDFVSMKRTYDWRHRRLNVFIHQYYGQICTVSTLITIWKVANAENIALLQERNHSRFRQLSIGLSNWRKNCETKILEKRRKNSRSQSIGMEKKTFSKSKYWKREGKSEVKMLEKRRKNFETKILEKRRENLKSKYWKRERHF